MAKAENGPLGPVKGKLGNLIFSSNLGTPYVRINPGTRKKGNKKEVNTRNAFTTLTWAFLNPIKPFLQVSYKEVAKGRRTLQAAISYLNKNAMERDANNNSVILPSKMLVSRGSLGMSAEVQVSLSEDRELQFSWNPHSASKAFNNDDQVLLVAYNVEAQAAVTAIGPAFRRDGSASLSLNDLPAGKLHVYLGFISYDRSKASDSLYLGMLIEE